MTSIQVIVLLAGLVVCAAIFLYAGVPYLYGKYLRFLLSNKAIKSHVLVLTFDDGPGDRLTPAILKILFEYKVKATFFLLGRNIVGLENIVRQIAEQGHDIYSHGYGHVDYWNVSPIRSVTDIVRGWRAIDDALGTKGGKYPFRPPGGKLNIVSLLYLLIRRVPIYYWSIVSGDTLPLENRDPQKIASVVQKKGGGIALIHDFTRTDPSGDAMILESVRAALDMASQSGIQVKSMAQLLASVK